MCYHVFHIYYMHGCIIIANQWHDTDKLTSEFHAIIGWTKNVNNFVHSSMTLCQKANVALVVF